MILKSMMHVIWKSDPSNNVKRSFFRAIGELALMYGAPAWTLTKTIESKHDGTQTWMLKAILNISSRQPSTKSQLAGPFPDISTINVNAEGALQDNAYEQKKELREFWTPSYHLH